MARRRKSSPHPRWIAAAAVFILVLAAGFYFFGSSHSTPHRTVPELDPAAYLENSNILRGNVYRLEGKVSESLAWSPDSGRLIAVETSGEIVPVLVTPEFQDRNIQKEQQLVFLVEVDEQGILRTRKMEKS
jgi:hypothetical protein